MKKMVMIAVIATVCFTGISLIAGTTDDKTVKTEKKTESVVSENGKDNSGPENLGPSVALNKWARGGAGGGLSIYLNIYYATNQCNAYVAYETDDKEFARPMAVRECSDCSKLGHYFVEKGTRYYFDL